MKNDLSAHRLRELVTYDPQTGIFVRKKTVNHRAKAGSVAGCLNTKIRYIQFAVDGKLYYAHRLAWLYMTGSWPDDEIDHENLNRSDNRWSNLRPANRQKNCGNIPAHHDNKSGLKGVSWHRGTSKWVAWIMVRGHKRYLGLFETPELAHVAYCAAAVKGFREFART